MQGKTMTRGRMRTNPWAIPLIILAIAASIWLGSQIARPWMAGLATANVLICAMGIIRSVSQGLRPVATVFYTFTFAWLGVAPAIQISTGRVAWGDIAVLSEPAQVTAALLMILVSMVAFFFGAEAARLRAERHRPTPTVVIPFVPARVRSYVLIVITVASVVLLPLAVQANGGLSALFSTRAELTGLRAAMGGSKDDIGGPAYALTRILPSALALAGALLSVHAIRSQWMGIARIRITHLLTLCVATLSLILFSNPLSNTRFIAAAAIGSILIAGIRPRSTRSGFLFAASMLAVTLFVYPLANAFRAKEFSVKTGTEAFTSGDFDGFQQAINTLGYVSDMGHTWGMQLVSGFGFFIPRSIWTGKAEPASPAIGEHAGYVFTNLSLPIHAEFYLEFGWLGVILGMGLLGFIAGRLDHAWLFAPESKLAFIAPYASLATLSIIRGPLGASAPVWGAVVVLLVLGITRSDRGSPQNTGNVPCGQS